MTEVILSICLALGFISLLIYLYFHEKAEREYIKKIQTDLSSLPAELNKFYAEISERDTVRNNKLIGESFKNYLKHIERLEKMVLPKPVTTKDVQSVMSRMGTMADESLEIAHDNEIENAEPGVELPNDNWTNHITGDTKIAFEGDEIPTVVEEE